jgi:hypothetical protein
VSGVSTTSEGRLFGARVEGSASCNKETDCWAGEMKKSSSVVGIGTGWLDKVAALSLISSLGLGLASGIGSMCIIGRPKHVGAGPSSITCFTTIGPFSPSSGKGPS